MSVGRNGGGAPILNPSARIVPSDDFRADVSKPASEISSTAIVFPSTGSTRDASTRLGRVAVTGPCTLLVSTKNGSAASWLPLKKLNCSRVTTRWASHWSLPPTVLATQPGVTDTEVSM